jgi:hypothetical protein
MGQYYRGVILKENKKSVEAHVVSYDFDSGAKLMEHSWVENPFVKAFETLIHNNPKRVVWAGDYADECKGLKTNVWCRCGEKLVTKPEYGLSVLDSIYVINHTKKQYVSKLELVNNDGWRIHPLPLLTCEGNGRGGGDFRSEDKNSLVGSWARDLISVSDVEPKEFKKIDFDLFED